MIPFVFFGSCIGSILTAALLHWMHQGAFAKLEKTARAEITRLRLTDAEREFLQALHNAYEESANQTGYVNAAAQADSRKNAAIIRGLLERL